MSKDPSSRGFLDELGIGRVEQDDDRAGSFADDLVDQSEGMSELAPSPTSATSGRAITSWPSATTIARPRKAVFALVGDQDPQMLGLAGVRERIHPPIVKPARSQDFDEGAPGGE